MTATAGLQDRISEQIREDLLGILSGDVRTDPGTLSLYATDASLHQWQPLAVAFPRSTEDVAAIVKYAAEHQLAIIPRGSGTGLVGGCLGAGIVVDFARYMNQILEIRDRTVVVQPGVVLDDLNRALAATGRHFPADPSNSAVTTIGGMIGVDAAGSRALRIGSTRDHVKSLQIVLADGSVQWLGTEPVLPGLSGGNFTEDPESHQQYARSRVILRRLTAILKENESLIRNHQPLLLRNSAGYMLRGVLQRGHLSFPRLFVGSEGTLGLCTQAVLHTSPLPVHRSVMLLLFSRFDLATQSLKGILEFQPSACDLLDRRLLTLARESSLQEEVNIPPHAEAALIVEFVADSENLLASRSEHFRKYVQNHLTGASLHLESSQPDEVQKLWQLPRQVVPMLARIKGRARPVPIIEDVVIPPECIGDFLHQAQRVLQRYQVTASLYAHAGSGQLHLRPFLELPTTESKATYESLARDLYLIVLEHGGSISGEHADGLSRTAFIRTQYGPLYRVFQQIKELFDPQHILNPEKIVSSDPHLTIRHLRPDAELVTLQNSASPQEHQLVWDTDQLASTASLCNGCGQCKTTAPGLRMCPFNRTGRSEFASPRAKANSIRNYLLSRFLPGADSTLSTPTDYSPEESLESCFNCKQCQLECPSQVDIPHLWLEAKAADVQQNGLSRVDWLLSRVGAIAGLTWRISWLMNLLFRSRTGRWLMEKTGGIDARRKLPQMARRPYLEQMRIRNRKNKVTELRTSGDDSTMKPVVIFLDYYANYHDPQIVQAFEAILRHHNIPYVVPLEQEGSGMTMINVGDLTSARELAEINLRVLGPYAREGHPIVCIEPSSAICLSQEYPLLLKHPDIRALSNQVYEAGGFLLKLHDQGLLKGEFSSVPGIVGYHEPCHQRALKNRNPYHQLLPLIPDLQLMKLDKGCSGMAGTFGLSRKNYDRSVQIGEQLLEAVIHENFTMAASECSACRLQMSLPEKKPVIHPLKLIAAAYRLIPLPMVEQPEPRGN